MKQFRWALMAFAVIAGGCAQSPQQPAATLPEDSAIRLIRDISLKQTSETVGANHIFDSLFRPIIAAPVQALRASGGVSQGDGFVSDGQSWCENPALKRNLLSEVIAAVEALCEQRGGKQQGQFCKRSNNFDEVIFRANLTRSGGTTTTAGDCRRINAFVTEPTGSRQHPGYVAVLQRAGFMTIREVEAVEAAERARQLARQLTRQLEQSRLDQLAAAERERHLAELPLMRKRGTTVCRAESGNTFKGYVEDSTDEKLQIRIAEAFRTGVPNFKLGGFQPRVIWDFPADWRLC